jgi:uncharacterized membrane protein YhaH (DUF805 family)
MSFIDAIKVAFRKYADFNGRATRSEFWWFYLFTALVLSAGYLVQVFISLTQLVLRDNYVTAFVGLLSFVISMGMLGVGIALMIPLLAVGCRRLHDRGQSGWLQLLLLVPCGSIALIVLWILEGTPGPNPYGPPPQRG